jgi:hypothetical protein
VCGEGDEQPTRVSPSTPPSLPLTCDDGYATALNRLRSQSCKLSTPHDIAASQHLSKTIANNDFDFHIQFKNACIPPSTSHQRPQEGHDGGLNRVTRGAFKTCQGLLRAADKRRVGVIWWRWGGIDCHVVETTTHSCIGHLSSPYEPNTTRESKESCDGVGRRPSCTPPHHSGFIS